MESNPCLTCGACCCSFRVSFYLGETTDNPFGTVPSELTEPVAPNFVAMRGTNQPSPRCVALQGKIGEYTPCAIYNERSSTCREFEASWSNGVRNEACDKARAKHGLAPLTCPAELMEAD